MSVLKSDPVTRRKIIYIYLLFVVLGAISIQWGFPEFAAFAKRKPPEEALNILLIILSIFFLSALPIAVYTFRYGNRILHDGQFPPRGAKIAHDTEIVVGDVARRKARIIILRVSL